MENDIFALMTDYDGENSERKGEFPDPNEISWDGRDWKFDQSGRHGIESAECEPVEVINE